MNVFWEVGGAGFAAFVLTLILLPLVQRIAKRSGAMRSPGGRHIHGASLPLWGGIAIVLVLATVILVHPTLVVTPAIGTMVFGIAFLSLIGARDDMRALGWRTLFVAQGFAALFLVWGGVRLDYINGIFGEAVRLDRYQIAVPEFFCISGVCDIPVFGALLVFFWVVAAVNAFNWLDGSHGSAASVASLAFLAVVVVSLTLLPPQPPVAILAATGLGATLGFLLMNIVHPRILLGNAGSFSIGYFLAALSVLAGAKLATVVMVLLLPAADACAVVMMRLLEGQKVWRADARHLHHDLIRRGWRMRDIAFLHATASLFFGTVAIVLPRPWKLLVLGVVFIVLIVGLLAMKRRRPLNE